MKQNLKTIAVVALLSSATTLGAYKILGLDKKEVIFSENTPSAFSRLTSGIVPSGNPGEFTYAAEKSTPAVVHIKSKIVRQVKGRQMPDIFDFFGEDIFGGGGGRGAGPQEGTATGSGVIISNDGYIVTNNHVVADAEELEVVLNDKRSFKAKVIGTDPNTDLAVIKIESSGLPFLTFGNSDEIRVGEWVLAVGNPFDLESTVTAGIISAKGRGIGILGEKGGNPIESFIQTDAAVNPGNSGGALVNLKGELIGINTAIISKTGNFAGYSFAVPVSLVRKVSGDLLKFGTVQRAFLGISQMREVNNKVAEELDLKATEGIYVGGFPDASVNSAAKAAGMKIGDVVTKIDGQRINTVSKLTEAVGRHKPGDVVKVTINRDGQEKDLNVVLKNLNGNTNIVKGDEVATIAGGSGITLETLGIKVVELTEDEKTKLKVEGGAKIVKVSEGVFADATQGQIEDGFVITKVDGKALKSARELGKLIGGRKSGIRLEGVFVDDPFSRYSFSF